MDRYTYRPPKKSGPALALAGGCFALCAALLVSLGLWDGLTGLRRTACVILAMIGIAITTRFILSSYIYVLERGSLSVSRIQGDKSVRIAAFSISDLDGIYGREELRLYEKQHGKIRIRRSYCRNLRVKAPYALIVSEPDGNAAVILEADDAFIGQLRRRWEPGQSVY